MQYLILAGTKICFTYVMKDNKVYDKEDGYIMLDQISELEEFYYVNKRVYNRYRIVELRNM